MNSTPGGDRLLAIATQAIAGCGGESLARRAVERLSPPLAGPVHLLGAGKAAVAMGMGVARALGPALCDGVLVTKDGDGDHHGECPLPRSVQVSFAAHPAPDRRSVAAGKQVLAWLAGLSANDTILVVLSGGASSLLTVPRAPLSLGALHGTTRALLAGGIPIGQINAVRKHLSETAGGRLAGATKAHGWVLVISDVLDGDLSTIGSGPFVPDPSSAEQALAIARRVDGVPREVLDLLGASADGQWPENPKPGDPCFDRFEHRILASHQSLIESVMDVVSGGVFKKVHTLASNEYDVDQQAAQLRQQLQLMQPGELLVSGGEPTVMLPPHHGRGGRNQQLAMIMAGHLRDFARQRAVSARFLSLASDGGDGPTDAAGAMVDERSVEQLLEKQFDPAEVIAQADAYPALDAIGALIRTGETGTNVLDLHLLEIY